MKIGRSTSTQKTYGPYGINNIDITQRVQPKDDTDDITGAYVSLTSGTAAKKVNALTYSVPAAKKPHEKIYNYKSGSGVSYTDVNNMEAGDKIVYKTENGEIREYTYKTGDNAHNIMHAIGVSNNAYKNNLTKYINSVNSLKAQNNTPVNTYSDDYVQVSITAGITDKAV